MTQSIQIKTLNDPAGKHPEWPDYWLAWANSVQGDGLTETEAIASAKKRLAEGEEPAPAYRPT